MRHICRQYNQTNSTALWVQHVAPARIKNYAHYSQCVFMGMQCIFSAVGTELLYLIYKYVMLQGAKYED